MQHEALDRLREPSCSFEAVTRRAARWTSGPALPIAMLRPEWPNMSTSLGMSPIVANWIRECRVGREVADDLALVRPRMGDVQVVGLGLSGRNVVAELSRACSVSPPPDRGGRTPTILATSLCHRSPTHGRVGLTVLASRSTWGAFGSRISQSAPLYSHTSRPRWTADRSPGPTTVGRVFCSSTDISGRTISPPLKPRSAWSARAADQHRHPTRRAPAGHRELDAPLAQPATAAIARSLKASPASPACHPRRRAQP